MKQQSSVTAAVAEREPFALTTQMRNSQFMHEVRAFMRDPLPTSSLPFVYALADGIRSHGTPFLTSDYGKALLHILMCQSYGRGYAVDGYFEQERLADIFR